MLPGLTHVGLIDVPDTIGDNLRPDIGVVLASCEPLVVQKRKVRAPCPGTLVCVRPYDGTWLENADCGGYRPQGQIRIYGAFVGFDGAERSNWWDSVICGIAIDERAELGGPSVRLKHPYGDKIVIRLDPIVQTDGGVILGDLSKYRNGMATVLAVGPLERDVKVGDRVSIDIDMLLQTSLGLDLVDDRDIAVCTAIAINYVAKPAAQALGVGGMA